MLLHSIVFACRCARMQAEFEAVEERVDPALLFGEEVDI